MRSLLLFLPIRTVNLSRKTSGRCFVTALASGPKGYVALAARASVNSMLVVGLFDGLATWSAYAIAGASHATLWAAITGALALVPFLGYVAVIALPLQLAIPGAGASASAVPVLALGSLILFVGDRRWCGPRWARDGTRLPFVWVLMGCLGGDSKRSDWIGLIVGPWH